jgi:hypothetical protein
VHTIPRYRLLRRLLFPYSGEESLTLRQALRVMLAWMLLLPLIISLLALPMAMVEGFSAPEILKVFAFAFISGACIFGLLGLLIVWVNNRSARIRRAWKSRETR